MSELPVQDYFELAEEARRLEYGYLEQNSKTAEYVRLQFDRCDHSIHASYS